MSIPTIIFILVFGLPLLGFYFYIASKDKNKRKRLGAVVVAVLFIFAAIIAYFVNRGKGV